MTVTWSILPPAWWIAGRVIGGTSAGAPSFSGVLALLNQYLVSNGYQSGSGLGNINTNLYPLASSTPAHSTTLPLVAMSVRACVDPLCINTETSAGYNAGTGYDQTTGLGSVDAYTFISSWHTSGVSPNISVTATPDSVTTAGTTAADRHRQESERRHAARNGVVLGWINHVGNVDALQAHLEARPPRSPSAGGTAGLSSGSNTITGEYGGDTVNYAATARTL